MKQRVVQARRVASSPLRDNGAVEYGGSPPRRTPSWAARFPRQSMDLCQSHGGTVDASRSTPLRFSRTVSPGTPGLIRGSHDLRQTPGTWHSRPLGAHIPPLFSGARPRDAPFQNPTHVRGGPARPTSISHDARRSQPPGHAQVRGPRSNGAACHPGRDSRNPGFT